MRQALRVAIPILLMTLAAVWALGLVMPVEIAAGMAYRRGNAPAAANGYLEAAVRVPEDPQRLFSAGSAQIRLDDAQAAALLLRAYDRGSGDTRQKAAYNAGVALFLDRDYFGAADAFRAVLEADPDDADARFNYELALRYALPPTPSEQQQQIEPELGETDPTVTPSPEPGGFDGPTPTPPREEFEPDPTATPVGGTGDFGDDADSTPVPVESGPMTLEEAMRLLDAAAEDALTIAPFYATPSLDGEPGENDW